MSADPVRLEQAIAALLSNAAKFTDPGGRIAMTIAREGDQAVVRVRDTGIGLSPAMLVRAFEMFAQGDQGLARSAGGLGIGLTLARNLVRLHGGTVEAASEGPGQGSEFIVRLPITPAALDATPSASAPDALAPRNGTLAGTQNGTPPETSPPEAPAVPVAVVRVLLVDDNRDAARSTELLLRQAGHEVLVAHDGPSALELAFKEHPDLVILDVGLPFIDGYGVARELRRQSSIPLVALTGYSPEESTSLLFDAYLVKPVNPAELMQLMGEFTGSEPRP